MVSVLYTVIIYPLTQVIEFCFMLVYQIFKDSGFAIIGVSLAVSVLCLPLYIVAEAWSDIERKKVASLARGVSRIKATFTGDEQYMILSTFYKQNNYSPIMALRSSFGLLIQIPFFIAAYNFLSNCHLLQNESFLFIKNLSIPDNLFSIGSLPVNILPIAMTAINIAASAIYTKGFSLREKLPIYIMALIFLVILYTSPSGLVLYWTMNNLFSLVKNVFYKIKRPLRALYALTAIAVLMLDSYLIFIRQGFLRKRLLLCALITLILFAPLLVKAARYMLDTVLKTLVQNKSARHALFIVASVSMFLLFGVVIPSLTIKSSVVEFMGIDGFYGPLPFLWDCALKAFGIFVFWALCVYALFGRRVQAMAAVLMTGFLFIALVDTFVFSGDYATLTRVITFSAPVSAPNLFHLFLNIVAILVCFLLPVILVKFYSVLSTINIIVLIGCAGLGVVNIASIVKSTAPDSSFNKRQDDALSYTKQNTDPASDSDIDSTFTSGEKTESDKTAVYHLTKTGKNVVLIMLDRAQSSYLESVFDENEALAKMYDGFRYYKNCVSYNQGTLLAAPALFGGYEYTPFNINKRATQKLVDKHNEALLLLPRIFSEESDFNATVTDLSWANYSWTPDLSICDPYPAITGSNLEGSFTGQWISNNSGAVKPNLTSTLIKRNLLWFSLFRTSPNFLREAVYHEGTWWASDDETNDIMEFLDYYSTLTFMGSVTSFDSANNEYICLVNDTTHSGADIKRVDPTIKTSLAYSNIGTFIAALKGVGQWLNLLRENNCYDNTRIVIVSDHGMGSRDGERLTFSGKKCSELGDYNGDHNHPLLLFKDFGSVGHLTIDTTFMTNADVPLLLTGGVIDNAKNPFTGNVLSDCVTLDSEGNKCAYGVILTHNWSPSSNGKNTFSIPKGDCFTVKSNVLDYNNWEPYY